MGLDLKRSKFPIYILLAVIVLLMISEFNGWSYQNDLKAQYEVIGEQLQTCSQQKVTCTMERLTLDTKLQDFEIKLKELADENTKLGEDVGGVKKNLLQKDMKLNKTLNDLVLCKAELSSQKNLEESKSTMLETLRLEKDSLASKLAEKSDKIDELEKEIGRLRTVALSKSSVTPSLSKPSGKNALNRQSPVADKAVVGNPDEDPENEDTAREVIDNNVPNDGFGDAK